VGVLGGVGEPTRRADSVVDVLARWLGLRANPAAVIFGTITVGAVLAGENVKGETVAKSAEAALLVVLLYWFVHSWSDDTGDRIAQRRRLLWRPFVGALEHQSTILRSVLIPVAALVAAGLSGATDSTALWVGTATCAVVLVLIEFVSAMHNRLPAPQVLAETMAGAVFGCTLLVLRYLVA
jgi:hypothetical protein